MDGLKHVSGPFNVHAFVEQFAKHLLHHDGPAVPPNQSLEVDLAGVNAVPEDPEGLRHLSEAPANLPRIWQGHRQQAHQGLWWRVVQPFNHVLGANAAGLNRNAGGFDDQSAPGAGFGARHRQQELP